MLANLKSIRQCLGGVCDVTCVAWFSTDRTEARQIESNELGKNMIALTFKLRFKPKNVYGIQEKSHLQILFGFIFEYRPCKMCEELKRQIDIIGWIVFYVDTLCSLPKSPTVNRKKPNNFEWCTEQRDARKFILCLKWNVRTR